MVGQGREPRLEPRQDRGERGGATSRPLGPGKDTGRPGLLIDSVAPLWEMIHPVPPALALRTLSGFGVLEVGRGLKPQVRRTAVCGGKVSQNSLPASRVRAPWGEQVYPLGVILCFGVQAWVLSQEVTLSIFKPGGPKRKTNGAPDGHPSHPSPYGRLCPVDRGAAPLKATPGGFGESEGGMIFL